MRFYALLLLALCAFAFARATSEEVEDQIAEDALSSDEKALIDQIAEDEISNDDEFDGLTWKDEEENTLADDVINTGAESDSEDETLYDTSMDEIDDGAFDDLEDEDTVDVAAEGLYQHESEDVQYEDSADFQSEAGKIKGILEKVGMKNYPKQLLDVLTMLKKNGIFKCIPKHKKGSCFVSDECQLPQMKIFGKPFSATIHICTKPWAIKIYYSLPKYKWWVKLRYNPIIIPISNKKDMGVTEIHSRTHASARAFLIVKAKGELQIDGTFRWDCTKPTYSQALRAKYNALAPNRHYNAIFYKFKVRFQLKRKKFWVFGGYKCWKCQTVMDKQQILGYGPRSCSADTKRYLNRPKPVARRRRRRRRRWFGKK